MNDSHNYDHGDTNGRSSVPKVMSDWFTNLDRHGYGSFCGNSYNQNSNPDESLSDTIRALQSDVASLRSEVAELRKVFTLSDWDEKVYLETSKAAEQFVEKVLSALNSPRTAQSAAK